MKPNELIEGLKNLAMQAPIDAVLFKVPSAPGCTDHAFRLDVSPRDVLDLIEYVQGMEVAIDDLAATARTL